MTVAFDAMPANLAGIMEVKIRTHKEAMVGNRKVLPGKGRQLSGKQPGQ
jgi:hypothetical protein